MLNGKYTVQREAYPAWGKSLNSLLGFLQWCGTPLATLEEDSIVHAAQRMTGLNDWGSQDFLQPLRVLLEDCNQARCTALGKVIARQGLIAALSQRLLREAHLKKHPEIEALPINRPIFILGFPRTGTTLLQNLLALGQGRRALQMWELLAPVPLATNPEVDRKKRIRRAKLMLKMFCLMIPEMKYIHDTQASSLDECSFLFVSSCTVVYYDLIMGLQRFGDWLFQHQMLGPYREYRRHLQILAQPPGRQRFILKYPGHLWFLDTLLAVFPDACIVWTHRDPVESIASCCSMFSLTRRTLYGKVDQPGLGQHVTERLLDGVTRAMAVRERVGSEQFFDVDFQALTKNPVAVVRQISEYFALRFDPETERAMHTWLQTPRNDSRGAHQYSLQRYGLEPQAIHQRYAHYIQRFDIPLQSRY